MLRFNFDAQAGETPASVAQKRALIAQIMGSQRAPATFGEGLSSIGDGIVANVEGGRAREAETMGRESADSTYSAITAMLTGQGGSTPSSTYGSSPSVPSSADAASIRDGLIARGLPEHVADGFLMNFQDESGLNPGINEQNPTVPGSRGGYGLYQLTGPRRVAYEQYAQERGVDPSNVDAQLDFMMSELQGPEAKAAQSIFAAPDAGSAAAAIATNFLRPAQQHLDARVSRYTSGGNQPGAFAPRTEMATTGFGRPNADGTVSGSVTQEPIGYNVWEPQQPTQVASLDPSIGAPAAAPAAQLPPIAPPQTAQAAPMAAPAPMPAPQASVQTAQGPSLQMLMEAAANPWLNENQKATINAMISQEMQKLDPAYQMDLERSQLELEALRNPVKEPIEVGGVLLDPDTMEPLFDSRAPSDNGFTLSPGQQRFDAQGNPIATAQPEPGFRQLTPEEIARTPNLDPNKAWQVGPDNKVYEIGGGGVNVSVGGASPTPGDDKFYEALGTESGKRYSSMIAQGSTARRNLSQLDVASDLLATAPQGPMGVATLLAGKFGVDLGGLDETQALNAVIEQMVPAQREPGSGPMSDKDIEMYRGSVVSLSNMPGGNKLIIDTARAINQYDVQIAEIAGKVEDGLITRAQAREEMANVPNPIDAFREARKAVEGGAPAPAAPPPNQSQPSDIDDILKGYGL